MGSAEVQGELWGAAAEDWAELGEPAMCPVYEASFDEMAVVNGTRLLDIGCGAGLALQLGHKRGAEVAGIDASEGLLRIARARLPEADLRQGEIEELPYDDDSFDAVTAFNAVQYATDAVQALREMRRVASPGSRVAVVTWGDRERCEARVLMAAVGALLPPGPPGAGGPFALAAPGALEALVESAHLSDRARDRGGGPVRLARSRHGGPGQPVLGSHPRRRQTGRRRRRSRRPCCRVGSVHDR